LQDVGLMRELDRCHHFTEEYNNHFVVVTGRKRNTWKCATNWICSGLVSTYISSVKFTYTCQCVCVDGSSFSTSTSMLSFWIMQLRYQKLAPIKYLCSH